MLLRPLLWQIVLPAPGHADQESQPKRQADGRKRALVMASSSVSSSEEAKSCAVSIAAAPRSDRSSTAASTLARACLYPWRACFAGRSGKAVEHLCDLIGQS